MQRKFGAAMCDIHIHCMDKFRKSLASDCCKCVLIFTHMNTTFWPEKAVGVAYVSYIYIGCICAVCTSVELNVCLRLRLLVYMSKIEGYISYKRSREGGRRKENCTLDFHFVIRI